MKIKNVVSKLKVLLFDEEILETFKRKSNWKYFVLFLLSASLLESLPTSIDEIQKVPFYFVTSVLKLFILSFTILGIGVLLEMKAKPEKFLGATFITLFIAKLLTTILAYVNIILLQKYLNLYELAQLIHSILPFYAYAVFAWGCEDSAELSESKGILFAVLCLVLIVLLGQIQIFFFHFY